MTAIRLRRDRERGQATVEFALVLPFVVVAVLMIAQVGVLVATKLEFTHAAREAARSLAVEPSLSAASIEAQVGHQVEVTFVPSDLVPGREIVQVRIREPLAHVSPLFSPVLDSIEVQSTAYMLVEEP